jgi:hypothetical protein
MAERISDCRFEIAKGSHAMIQENPDVCSLIADFLQAQ